MTTKYGPGDENVLRVALDRWRSRQVDGWGLAWFLAAQLCRRYYESHGIVPHVIDHEGLGYYGIQIDKVSCTVNGRTDQPLGRFTITGNVENWATGRPGDHGLNLEERMRDGEPVEPMIAEAIQHLNLPSFPGRSHLSCRHKRWGASYVVLFEMAALLALRHNGRIAIWNHDIHTTRLGRELDKKHIMKEHPGYFLIKGGPEERKVVIAGDGRVLEPVGEESLWERYMEGESISQLAKWVEEALDGD